MPIQSCTVDGKPGYRYGASGKCYPYTEGNDASMKRAKKQAIRQALAIGGGKAPSDLTETELAESGMKKCTSCGLYRTKARFSVDGRTGDGHSKLCVDCRFKSDRSFAADLETVNVDGIELLTTGGPYFGEGSPEEGDTFDDAFLKELAQASQDLVGEIKVPIKIGHSKAQRLLKNSGLYTDEQPAAGWVENIRYHSGKLLGDLKDVPKKIADLMEAKAFRTRSVEMKPVTSQTKDGKEYPAVVTALALLGAKAPAVRTLDDIRTAWYAERDPNETLSATAELLLADEQVDDDVRTYAQGEVVWDSENGSSDWQADLGVVLNASEADPGMNSMEVAPSPYYVEDIDQRSMRALVCDWRTNTHWVVPFSLSDGDPVPMAQDAWTLAEQAWISAAADTAITTAQDYMEHAPANQIERLFKIGRVVLDARASGDTKSMSATETPSFDIELSDEQIDKFAELFKLDEADAAKKKEAVLAKLAERLETPGDGEGDGGEGDGSSEGEGEGEGAPPPAAAATTGTVLSESELKQLRDDAALGRRMYEERSKERIEATVNAAQAQGRIMPESRKRWLALGERDYELMVTQLMSQPIQVNLMRSFGSDDDGSGSDDDSGYRAYAGATGVIVPQKEAK